MRILPREEKFFHYFFDQVSIIGEAAESLLAGVQAGRVPLAEAAEKIAALEQRGGAVVHDIFRKLNETFITPIDPEDIHKLGSRLDAVLDGIEEAAHRLWACQLEPVPGAVAELCRLIQSCAKSLERAFQSLSQSKNSILLEHCIEINRLQKAADQVFRGATAALFREETNAIQLLQYKEVYEALRQTINRCQQVAEALLNVAVKNS